MDYTDEFLQSNTKEALDRYAGEDRVPTGGFLRAVLEGDLFKAFARADTTNTRLLPEIVKYIYNHLPMDCWGNYTKVENWLCGD